MTASGGQRRVPTQYLNRLNFPLLGLGDQRRVAVILDRAAVQRAPRRAHLELPQALEASAWMDAVQRPGGSISALGDFVRWCSGNFLAAS